MEGKIKKSEKEWKSILNKEQYDILRNKDTERPFTGKYWNNFEKGVYVCAGCGQELFGSVNKFESDCGWPSYDKPIDPKAVMEEDDNTLSMKRTEILCSNCQGHLGHVFNDGPKNTTGLRYCINSASLDFKKDEK